MKEQWLQRVRYAESNQFDDENRIILWAANCLSELEAENNQLKEFRRRTAEALRAIQDDVSYSQKVKPETAIYGSFSCQHETHVKELEATNAALLSSNKRMADSLCCANRAIGIEGYWEEYANGGGEE